MEVRNSDKLAYLIYCERHTPLKLRRLFEHKDKKYKVILFEKEGKERLLRGLYVFFLKQEEIIKFCKSIERSREFRKKERSSKKEKDR